MPSKIVCIESKQNHSRACYIATRLRKKYKSKFSVYSGYEGLQLISEELTQSQLETEVNSIQHRDGTKGLS